MRWAASEPRPLWRSVGDVSFLVFSLIAGLWVRVAIAGEPLWLDEMHTDWVIAGPASDVAERAAWGNQPPVFFWLVALAKSSLASPFDVRWLSLFAGGLVLFTAAGLVRLWTGSLLASGLVTFLLAFDLTFLFYASEARPYALLQWLGLVQIGLCWQTWKSGNWLWGGLLVACSVAMFYVHYTAALLFAAQALYLVARGVTGMRSRARWNGPPFWMWLVLGLVGLVCCWPAWSSVWSVWARRAQWDVVSSPQGLALTLTLQLLTLGLPALLLGRLGSPTPARSDSDHGALLGWLFCCGTVPGLLVLALVWVGHVPLAADRYVQAGATALPLMAAVAVGSWRAGPLTTRLVNRFQIIATVGLVFGSIILNLSCWSALASGRVPTLRLEDWRGAIATLNAIPNDGARVPLILFSNLVEDGQAIDRREPAFQEYLCFPVAGREAVDRRRYLVSAGSTLARPHFHSSQLDAILDRQQVFVLVRATPWQTDEIIADLLAALPATARVRIRQSPGSYLSLFEVAWD